MAKKGPKENEEDFIPFKRGIKPMLFCPNIINWGKCIHINTQTYCNPRYVEQCDEMYKILKSYESETMPDKPETGMSEMGLPGRYIIDEETGQIYGLNRQIGCGKLL